MRRDNRRRANARRAQSSIKSWLLPAALLSVLVGVASSYAMSGGPRTALTSVDPSAVQDKSEGDTFVCSVASITDGDTLRCFEAGEDGRQIRIRVSGISARERDGTCSEGHPCPSGSAQQATAELTRLAAGEKLQCHDVGRTYDRVAAFCRNSRGVDLSCAMVASGTAARWDRHWVTIGAERARRREALNPSG